MAQGRPEAMVALAASRPKGNLRTGGKVWSAGQDDVHAKNVDLFDGAEESRERSGQSEVDPVI